MSKLYVSLNIQRFASSLSIASSVTSQSIADNTSIVNITVTIKRTSGSTYWIHPNYRYLTIICDGQSYGVNTELPSNKTSVTYSHEFTVTHNNDGTKYIEYSASLPKTSSFPALSTSGNATLPTIPRQPNYSWINASNITETSVRLTAGIDTHGLGITAGGWDVSPDGGSTWTYYANDPTDKTITGLLPNKQYWYRGYCATAGGSSNSGWSTFTTYDYPKANAVNDITLRENTTFTIGFYNPFGKTFSYQIISNVDSSVIYSSGDVNITSATINMNDLLTNFYNTIPNAKESTYYVKTTYNGNTRNSASKKYTIDADTCKPIMSVVGYEDVNNTTLALTNNNQYLVVGYSTIQVTIADGNKATPQYNATIVGYKIKNGDYLSPMISESSGEDVILTCPATSGVIEVYAIDSREQSGVYQIVNTTMINYENITKNQSPIAQRTDSHGDPNGVGEYVKITLSGSFWNNSFGLVTNSIKSITYQYANSKTPTTLIDGTTTIVETVSNDDYEVSQLILGDTQQGFDISNSYTIWVTVGDELSTTTFTITLTNGTPLIAYADDGISIKGMYDTNDSSVLQVAGDTSIDGNIVLNGIDTIKAGSGGDLYIGANNNNLILRPKGIGTWQGQTYFKTDGSMEQDTGDKIFTSGYDGSYYWLFHTDANEFKFDKQVVSNNIWATNRILSEGNAEIQGNVDLSKGGDLVLGSQNTNNDSGDIIWKYSNGNEKTRIWTDNTPDGFGWLPHVRTYNSNGGLIREGRLLSNMVLEISNQNILDLEPGLYFKEGNSGWTDNGWPVTTWHATLIVIGFNSGGGYGWKTLFCHDNSNNKVYVRSQQWSSWSSWKEL